MTHNRTHQKEKFNTKNDWKQPDQSPSGSDGSLGRPLNTAAPSGDALNPEQLVKGIIELRRLVANHLRCEDCCPQTFLLWIDEIFEKNLARETDSIPGSEDRIAKQGSAESRPDTRKGFYVADVATIEHTPDGDKKLFDAIMENKPKGCGKLLDYAPMRIMKCGQDAFCEECAK